MAAASKNMTRERLAKALEQLNQWATIDQIAEQLDSIDFWDADFLTEATANHKRSWVRRQIRELKDADHWPVIASVIDKDEEGNEVRRYKAETLFDIEDYRQVVAYNADRSMYFGKMALGYRMRGVTRFRNAQIPMPLLPGRIP